MTEDRKLLIVDDSPDALALLSGMCESMGFYVESCESGEALLELGDRLEGFDAILLDIVLPGIDGFETLRLLREREVNVPTVMVTIRGDRESVERAILMGASDFVTKPVDSVRLRASLANAIRMNHLFNEVHRLSTTLRSIPGFSPLRTESPTMKRVLHAAQRAARNSGPILIQGGVASGKEVLARHIHTLTSAPDKPFVTVRCNKGSERELKREIFGSTGATPRPGALELASGGTLFLDRAEVLSKQLQAELLQVLTNALFTRLGSKSSQRLKARILASTAVDLQAEVENKEFDDALYSQLSENTIRMPELRERREDIPPLAEYFLQIVARAHGGLSAGFESAAIDTLKSQSWPGNIGQLRAVIERLYASSGGRQISAELCRDEFDDHRHEDTGVTIIEIDEREMLDGQTARVISDELLQQTVKVMREGTQAQSITDKVQFENANEIIPLSHIERAAILSALRACKGDIQETAKRLEISRATIYRRLRRYGLSPDQNR